ncbi:hypothetical protein PO124_21085 [Bacillus licheniformis]|nr:hypothetical protein [Bacillus licheniformis]
MIVKGMMTVETRRMSRHFKPFRIYSQRESGLSMNSRRSQRKPFKKKKACVSIGP